MPKFATLTLILLSATFEPCCGAPAPSRPVTAHDVALPALQGPLPDTASSYAFNSAAHARVPLDLSRKGYVEEEYFQRGIADIYNWPAPGKITSLGSGPYVTRILVRRPKDPQRFNGAVIIEPLNSSHMADADLMWMFSHEHFMAQGYIWIGLTVKPVSGAALKRFNPTRYAPVSFASPLPVEQRCVDRELGPEERSSEIGLAFDALAQLGALVRSDVPQNPWRGYPVTRVYMTGYSQTAGYDSTYATALSSLLTYAGGKRIYDGYLDGGHGPFNVVLNTCAPLFLPGDPRLPINPVGVPYIDIAGEGDTLVTGFMQRADGDTPPDLSRRYEVAGATHSGSLLEAFAPNAQDFARAGGLMTSVVGCVPDTQELSDFPFYYVMDAMWQNLDDWVVKGVLPPPGKYLTLVPGGMGPVTVKDANGNAIGGVRTPAVDVPTATWHSSRGGLESCMRVGYGERFDSQKLHSLYPTHADYVRKVSDDVHELQAGRWLTSLDAQHIIDQANAADVP